MKSADEILGLLEQPAIETPMLRLGQLHDVALMSAAISLKRIADSIGEGAPFLTALAGTLDDASHNHQQRMRNL